MAWRARAKFEDDLALHAAIANGRDDDGNTLYHHASQHGCIKILRRLGRSPELDARNATGQTALHLAASVDCVQWLVENGAEVNAPDANGQTPIFRACSLAVVQVLLRHGALARVKDVMNNTPVHCMLMRSHLPEPASLQLLLDAGADANGQNHKLWTPLFYCAFAGTTALTRFFMSFTLFYNDIVFFVADQDNEDKQRRLKHLVLLLLDKGADPDAVDMIGFTVAHYLALKGRCQLLSIVLPRLTYNVSSVSRQTVKHILFYYYKDDSSLCRLVKCVEKKEKRHFSCSTLAHYQASTSQTIDCYYRLNNSNSGRQHNF